MRRYGLVFLAVCGLYVSDARAAVEYVVTDLTELWRDSESSLWQSPTQISWSANALNDQGQVVGSVESFAIGDDTRYAILWDESNGLQEIGNLGATDSIAIGINNNGQVVGASATSQLTDGTTYPFLWSEASGMSSLGSLSNSPNYGIGVQWSRSININDQGVVVGTSESDGMVTSAFIWTEAAGMQPVGDFIGASSFATAINNSGQIVGFGDTASNPDSLRRAFIWDEDFGSQLLPLVDDGTIYETSEAHDINDLGDVVGQIYSSDDSSRLAILWQNGEAHDLGSLSGTHSSAHAINETGVIVGYSDVSGIFGSHAFIWDEERGMRDLNELIEPTLGIELYGARDINNNGWILADAQYTGHIFLLTPVPEPGTVTLLLTGAFCLPFFFCKRLLRIFC